MTGAGGAGDKVKPRGPGSAGVRIKMIQEVLGAGTGMDEGGKSLLNPPKTVNSVKCWGYAISGTTRGADYFMFFRTVRIFIDTEADYGINVASRGRN